MNPMQYLRKGREFCNDGAGNHPMYVNVDMTNGHTANNWVDSLQAAFPGLQVRACLQCYSILILNVHGFGI